MNELQIAQIGARFFVLQDGGHVADYATRPEADSFIRAFRMVRAFRGH